METSYHTGWKTIADSAGVDYSFPFSAQADGGAVMKTEPAVAPTATEPPTVVLVPMDGRLPLDEVCAHATSALDEAFALAMSGVAFQLRDAAGRLHSFPAGFGPQGEQVSGFVTVPGGLGRARRTADRLNRRGASASL
jgi:hypothetical protein